MAIVSDTYYGSTRVIIHDDYILHGEELAKSIKRFTEIATRDAIARQVAEQLAETSKTEAAGVR